MNERPDSDNLRPSKTALKRESTALQALGERLIGLPPQVLDALDLPERLHDAVVAARTMTRHGALRRQRQYIGRLMRDTDVAGIRETLDARAHRDRAAVVLEHAATDWRRRLLEDGESALDALLSARPDADRQRLRQYLRNAADNPEGERARRATRELYRYLRDLLTPPPD